MVEMNPVDTEKWQVIWTQPAVDDLLEIVQYISHDSKFYASAVAREIYETAESLSVFPLRGRVVPEFARDDVREIFSQSHRIIYRLEPERVAIIAIIHFSRGMNFIIDE